MNNAFLHRDLDEEVFIKLSPGLSVSSFKPLVCKLQKSLYGLRQASRQWYAKFSKSLESKGYVHSLNDYSLFTKGSGNFLVLLAVYVDDIVLIGTDLDEIAALKIFLHNQFKIKDLGILHYFLGIEMLYTPPRVLLHQSKFIGDLLKEFHCDTCTLVVSPLELHEKLLAKIGTPFPKIEVYRSLIGKLNFLAHTRRDLSFMYNTLVSLCSCLVHLICELLYIYSDTSKALLTLAFSFQVLLIFPYKYFVTVIGEPVLIAGGLFLVFVFLWVIVCFVGNQRSNLLSP